MGQSSSFAEVLEAVDQLSEMDQEILVDIVRRRVAERGRSRLADDVQEAEAEFERGECRIVTADELIDEIRP